MGLPWVRLDSSIASHDKTLRALGQRGGKGAMAVYVFALGYAGGHGTDGHIPAAALPMLHGTPVDADILVRCGLWDPDPDGNGWWVHNYAHRQELTTVTEAKREAKRINANRTNCIRWHGPECGCWQRGQGQIRRVK